MSQRQKTATKVVREPATKNPSAWDEILAQYDEWERDMATLMSTGQELLADIKHFVTGDWGRLLAIVDDDKKTSTHYED